MSRRGLRCDAAGLEAQRGVCLRECRSREISVIPVCISLRLYSSTRCGPAGRLSANTKSCGASSAIISRTRTGFPSIETSQKLGAPSIQSSASSLIFTDTEVPLKRVRMRDPGHVARGCSGSVRSNRPTKRRLSRSLTSGSFGTCGAALPLSPPSRLSGEAGVLGASPAGEPFPLRLWRCARRVGIVRRCSFIVRARTSTLHRKKAHQQRERGPRQPHTWAHAFRTSTLCLCDHLDLLPCNVAFAAEFAGTCNRHSPRMRDTLEARTRSRRDLVGDGSWARLVSAGRAVPAVAVPERQFLDRFQIESLEVFSAKEGT